MLGLWLLELELEEELLELEGLRTLDDEQDEGDCDEELLHELELEDGDSELLLELDELLLTVGD